MWNSSLNFARKVLNSQVGFNLIEVTMATVLLSIAGVGLMNLSQLSSQDSLKLKIVRSFLNAANRIDASIKNPTSWKKTLNSNSSFSCLTSSQGCSLSTSNSQGYYDFVIYGPQQNEKVSFDPADQSTRISIRGESCSATTDYCPLKYTAQWKPLCASYPCTNPEIDILVTPKTDSSLSFFFFDPTRYKYEVTRGVGDGSTQSACLILNGVYNSTTGKCEPKQAGKTCAGIGKPSQIIDSVDINGNITCKPLYSGLCNSSTQVMNGLSSSGTALCTPKTQPANCPVDCVGGWGNCSKTCGGGIQTYTVIIPASNGGAACTNPSIGSTQFCNTSSCPVNCQGNFTACSQPCGGGTMTYQITQQAQAGGSACPYSSGATLPCNTQACSVAVNCNGYWSACNTTTGTMSYTITQQPQNGGAACPSPTVKSCQVNCAGSWSSCNNGYKTYTWNISPKNGGASCPYSNGQTDSSGCASPINCSGGWGNCSKTCGGGLQTYTVYTPEQNGGASCEASNGQSRSCNTQACLNGTWRQVGGWTCIKNYSNPTYYNQFGQVIPSPPIGNCPDPLGIGIKGAFIEGTSCSPIGSSCLDDCAGSGFDVQQRWVCQ